MTIIIDAIYENGLIRPKQPLDLGEGAELRVTVTPVMRAEPVTPVMDPGPLTREDIENGGEIELDPNDPLAGVIGIGEGVPDGASRHDDYIYGRRNPS
jgi:predicted DNA-binding antitoxin AbrB/MazE fold protein